MVFFDPFSLGRGSSWKYLSSRSGPTLHWGKAQELARLYGVDAQLRVREENKSNHNAIRRLLNESDNNTIYTIIMSACGAMSASMVGFIKGAFGRAKETDSFA